MEMNENLTRFVESATDDRMPSAAANLLELIEADEVEPIAQPGDAVIADDMAESLESRLDKVRRRSTHLPDGVALIEDAIAALRAHDDTEVEPWSFEDSNGIRWFVVISVDDDAVVACYTTAPFIEADI